MFRFRRQVYLDNNATTSVTPNVRKKMCAVLKSCYGNPSSRYFVARNAAAVLETARNDLACATGALPDEIIFTGSASEANNQVLKSFLPAADAGRTTIISSPIEHASVIATLEWLKGMGMMVIFCPVDSEGRLDLVRLESLTDERTLLICCMFANNETGVVQDVSQVVEIAKKHGARVLSDCVQALGKLPVDVKALGVDYATFSAHKIHGPKGVGALYVRQGSPLNPLIHGGHQEFGLRAGTEGIHNIAGFAEACKAIPDMLARTAAVAENRDMFIQGVRRIQPDAAINSPSQGGLQNTISVTFSGFDNAGFIAFLDHHGIWVSAGSACNSELNEPSHVLTAMGLSADAARQTLRFSLSSETSRKDIRYTLDILSDYLQKRISPVNMVSPAQLNENLLFSESSFVIDIRSKFDRKILKGLPNSHETSAAALKKLLQHVPRDKNIVVVCQTGIDAPIAAYFLRGEGYKNVGFVMGGIVGWKLFQPGLYNKFGGMNISQLE